MVGVRARSGRRRKRGTLHKFVRLNDDLKEMLDYERKPGERYSDTLERILHEKTQKIQALAQEIDRVTLTR